MNIAAMQAKMMERLEVLTLQVIKQNKEIKKLSLRNQKLEEEIKKLK
jgi:cell division protein FtsB